MFYDEITIFELVRRIDFLIQTKKDIAEYFKGLSYDFMGHPSENDEASRLRQKINQNLRKITRYIVATGTSSSIFYTPPPAIGGIQGDIDLVSNMFNLSRFDISPNMLIDKIDQSIGIYNDEKIRALIRTLNPFWWAWKLIKKIVRFPFFLIQEAGFNTSKIERSFVGKLYSFISSVIVLLAALLAILSAFGYQDRFVSYTKGLLGL